MNFKVIIALLFLIALVEPQNEHSTLQEKSDFIEINGARHFYEILGAGDTLVILHGGPGLSHKYLKPQLDSLLSSNFTLMFYDQRGSGWTEGEKDTLKLTMSNLVDDLEQIRKHFKIQKLNLLGHSFGGLLAMKYAIAFPEKTNSMILVDTDAASYEMRTPYQQKMIGSRLSDQQGKYLDSIEATPAFKNFDPQTYEKYYKTFLTTYFANPADTSNLSLGFDSVSVPKIEITNYTIRKDLGKYDFHDKLSGINCRTLIMQGTESIFSVEGALAIKERIPSSEIHLFENTGHFEYIEAPAKFKDLILDFYGIK